MKGCDIDWSKPSGADLAAAGFKVASLYVGQDNTGKNMTSAVVEDYTSHAVAVVTNFEYGATQMASGALHGATDGRLGLSQQNACGIFNRPIYYSADWAVSSNQMAAVIAYLVAARSVTGPGTVGVYGSYYVVKAVHEYWLSNYPGEKVYLWQTVAWSNGNIYNAIDMFQDGTTLSVSGISVDYDNVISLDAGQWPAPIVEEDMDYIVTVTGVPDVYLLSGGKYTHLMHGGDLTNFRALGAKDVTISADTHAQLLAGPNVSVDPVGIATAITTALEASGFKFPTSFSGSLT